jgi:hypothetical protein
LRAGVRRGGDGSCDDVVGRRGRGGGVEPAEPFREDLLEFDGEIEVRTLARGGGGGGGARANDASDELEARLSME